MKKLLFLLMFVAFLSCQKEEGGDTPTPQPRCYSLTVSADAGFKWKSGDRICANGFVSDPLSAEYAGLSTVVFSFNESELPLGAYQVCFPATIWADSSMVCLPDSLGADTPMPMAGYSSGDEVVKMNELCSRLEVPVAGQSDISSIHLSAIGSDQLCGKFVVDYKSGNLSLVPGEAYADCKLRSTTNVFILPAVTYSEGFDVRLITKSGKYLTGSDKSIVVVQKGSTTVLNQPVYTFGGDYHQISSASQWNAFADSFNNGKVNNVSTTLADITADLDFSGMQVTSLALRSNPDNFYCAELDGNGHSVRNAELQFPLVTATGDGAYVHDIIIGSDCTLSPDYSQGRYEFSPLIGYLQYGKVQNCRNDAPINLVSVASDCYKDLYLGGVVARMENAHIYNCTNCGAITVDKSFVSTMKNLYVAGVCGGCVGASGTLKYCTHSGSIAINGSSMKIFAGGIIAYTKSYIQNSLNYGTVTVASPADVVAGGIAGMVDAKGCYQSQDNSAVGASVCVESCRSLICGGQYGHINAPMSLDISGNMLYDAGDIRVAPSSEVTSLYVGGLIGKIDAKTSLLPSSDAVVAADITIDCSAGLPSKDASVYVGGVVGYSGAALDIKGSYKAQIRYSGDVNLKSATLSPAYFCVGGILGSASAGANITYCHVDSKSIGGKIGSSSDIGGLIGLVKGSSANIWHCSCTADVVSAGGNTAGILAVANCDGVTDMSSCIYEGKITADSGTAAALVASAQKVAVSNSNLRADVTAPVAGGIYGNCSGSGIGADGVCVLNGTLNGTAITESNVKSLSCASGTASPNKVTTGIGRTRVSVLGDSISTHSDAIPAECRPYYPTSGAGNLTVSQTYWYILAYEKLKSGVLEQNVSYSGSCLSRNSDDVNPCFLTLYDRYGVGESDIVLIHGGTNDKTQQIDNYTGVKYNSVPSEAQFAEIFKTAVADLDDTKFVPAYYKLISKIVADHPKVKIVCIIGDALNSAQEQCIIKVSQQFPDNARYVDFYGDAGISKCSSCHPNAAGMKYMANTIYDRVGSWLEK